ncbi:LEAF RUST 10 DISEASE-RESISTANCEUS RECEPTOR-LIKE PROTEIN KINASE-like 2.1 isoform X1 [Oryza sativa Japonica Group]|nr:LEAF RUST 10 DISEASE-RESISTANCE LOCUS RECEPTOR-LIKE PROTEIN KINASE-like 2.1 isoform X1 [Oryza sativa Japonica Group]
MRRYGLALLGSHASHLLLLFWFIASGGEGATAAGGTYDDAICARPIFCGEQVEIKYPFYLSNTTDQVVVVDGNTRYCGYPWLGIICDHDRAILRLGNYNYTVLEINHGNHTVTVADSDALDGGDCPRVKHNVTLPEVLTFPSPGNDSITFFFDCNSTANVVLRPPPYIRPINCSTFDFPGRRDTAPSFVATQPDVAGETEWLGLCKEVVMVPVLKDWLMNEKYYGKLGDDGYGAVLKRGFQLSWDPTAGMCHECEVSGGRCSYGTKNEFLGCLCSDGRASSSTCGSKISKKKAIAIGVSVVSGVILLFLLLMCTLCVKKFWHGLLSSMGKSKEAPNIESFLQKHEAQHPKRYSYSEVKTMTKSFSHKLGQGGFGTVYMGKMPNGKPIAVKLLKSCKDDGQEFMNEVASISRTSHVNVVTLLGYCIVEIIDI